MLVLRAQIQAGPLPWLEPFYHWDARWYADIARDGYRYDPDAPSRTAFLPLLPLVMRGARAVGLDPYVAGVLVPNLAFVIGLACFGRICLRLTTSPRASWAACVALVCYPYSIYFSLPYPESLFFAASAGALLAWLDRRPLLAALLSGVAGLARLTAVALAAGVAAEAIRDRPRGRTPRPAWHVLVVAFGAGVGTMLFFGYLHYQFGDFFAHLKSHKQWDRESPNPAALMRVLGTAIKVWLAPSSYQLRAAPPHLAMIPYVILMSGLMLGALGWLRRGPLVGMMVLIPIVQAISTGSMMSIERIVLSAYPAALIAVEVFQKGGRWLLLSWIAFGALAQWWLLKFYVGNVFVA